METTTKNAPETLSFTIVCDERCAVVRSLAALISVWDRGHNFTFVDRDSKSQRAERLIDDLDRSRWSLFLVDNTGERWYGPEAIPMILKNLPFGKFAAVFYVLPGTMWVTRNFYMAISAIRGLFSNRQATA